MLNAEYANKSISHSLSSRIFVSPLSGLLSAGPTRNRSMHSPVCRALARPMQPWWAEPQSQQTHRVSSKHLDIST